MLSENKQRDHLYIGENDYGPTPITCFKDPSETCRHSRESSINFFANVISKLAICPRPGKRVNSRFVDTQFCKKMKTESVMNCSKVYWSLKPER